MDVTATLSLGDPLEPARKATAQMLQERERTFSLPQPFYSDERLFDIDMQEIFQKEWLIAGMTCEIPTKGNYITLQVGKNPIIVIRGADGVVHAFHNVCRHRGSRLCTSDKGKVAKLVCHYHQWTYELDGRLLFAGTEMGADFDMKQYGLKPVNVKTAGGYIFISLSQNPPAIDDFLSTLSHYMEPYDMENTKVAIQTTLFEKANWKLVLENNRECYHCNIGHPQYIRANYDIHEEALASAAVLERIAQAAARSEARWAERGLAATHREGGLAPFPDPVNNIWYSANRTLLAEGFHTESMDGRRVAPLLPGYDEEDVGVVRMRTMPNFWNHSSCDHAVSTRLLPAGLQKTLVRVYWLVHQDAQEGVDYDCERLLPFWQLTGEQDWKLCERAQRGVNSTGYEPGPLSTLREYNVEALLQWYLQQMQAAPAA